MNDINTGELYRGIKKRLKNEIDWNEVCLEQIVCDGRCLLNNETLRCEGHTEAAAKNILAALEDAYELGKQGAEVFAPLDADDKPCYMDEIVYHKDKEVRIVAISHKGNLSVRSTKIKSGHSAYWVKSTDVTHIESDTQKRIDEDARKDFCEYWECGSKCDKCPAKIDGKKPYEYYGTTFGCTYAQMADLLRRQRELDARSN